MYETDEERFNRFMQSYNNGIHVPGGIFEALKKRDRQLEIEKRDRQLEIEKRDRQLEIEKLNEPLEIDQKIIQLETTNKNLCRKQEAALEKIKSLIGGDNKNASTGIDDMNRHLIGCHHTHPKPTAATILDGLKKRAQERTSWSFFNLPRFSCVCSFFSSFRSLGRKKWVGNLYTALNSMNDPNNEKDVDKLLKELGNIKPDNSENISEKNNQAFHHAR